MKDKRGKKIQEGQCCFALFALLAIFALGSSCMQLPQFQVHAKIEDRHWWFCGRRTIFRALLSRLVPVRTGRKLLDVGCGTGGNTAAFSAEYDCTGVEPVMEAMSFARKHFPHCRFIQGIAPRDVPKEMANADIVLLADVLEHVLDDRTLVRDLIHAMKLGAVLLVMAPADKKLWSPHDRGFEHFRRYDLETARALWQGLPVEELVCSYCNSRL